MLPSVEDGSSHRDTPRTLERENSREPAEIPLEGLRRLVVASGKGLVAAALIGAGVGGVLMSLQPIRYDAVATLMAQPKLSIDAKSTNVSTFRALLESNTLAAAAIDKFHLDAPPYGMKSADFVRDTLIVDEVGNTNLIRVRARMADPKLAGSVANFVAVGAIDLNTQIDRLEASDFRSRLQSQLDGAAKRLRATEMRLLDFHKRSPSNRVTRDVDAVRQDRRELLRLTIDIEAEKARLASAQQEIRRQEQFLLVPRLVHSEAVLRSLRVDSRVDAARPDRLTEPAPKFGDGTEGVASPGVADRIPQPEEDEMRIPTGAGLDLSTPFVNPVYQVLDYQIALSRTKLAALEQRRRELVAQRLGGRELASLAAPYPQHIQLRRLETEHELARIVYAEIALRHERAQLQVASASPRFQLIDKAVEPTTPLPRHRVLGAIIGALVGFVLALIVLATRQFLTVPA